MAGPSKDEQIPFSSFSKLSIVVADQSEDLLVYGAIEFYDCVTPARSIACECFKSGDLFKVTIVTEDLIIRCLAENDTATVFATDTILVALMCAPRSIQSWDNVIQHGR
ncbi:unnamed protein product [Miscanthus lutarioriparius]|uniref:Uncharacterized protein n=1 Tax=Miscanthus lutarioriparius TaxID=422564 RepID=A0A811R5U2_9POAL|nr:unnamed protein product [Miscanthus lutarioriparius]